MIEISKQRESEFTPSWSAVLDALVDINSPVAELPPVSPQNSWEDVIERLLNIQQKRGYTDGWVIYQVLEAGNPPIEYWVRLSKKFKYGPTWPIKIRGESPEIAFPNIDAIGFDNWDEEYD